MTRILLVDDNPHLATCFEDRGYEVSVARDGVEALDLLRAAVLSGHVPDIAVVDLEMPRMDGAELIAEMQLDQRLRSVACVLNSGDLKVRAIATELGVRAHSKFDPVSGLFALIDEAISEKVMKGETR